MQLDELCLPIGGLGGEQRKKLKQNKQNTIFVGVFFLPSVEVIHIASNKDDTGPGASGQLQDHQDHLQDDQERLPDYL